MQTLWSRAAQSQCTCRCSFCLSFAASALSRRTTTATRQRRLKYGDAFTVFYSSIFATAAIVDAKRKEDRRKELDTAMAEVKKDLKNLEEIERVRAERARGYQKERGWREIVKLRPEDVDYRWTMRNLASNIIPPDLRKQLSKAQVEQILTSDHLLEQLGGGWKVHPARKGVLRNGDCLPQVTNESLQELSPMKLIILELSVAKLVLRFLGHPSSVHGQECPNGGSPQGLSKRAPMTRDALLQKVAKIDQNIQRLLGNKTPTQRCTTLRPARPAYDRGNLCVDDQRRLNATISTIFEEHCRSKDHALMLESICSLLLFAPSPPDVITYNLLLTHFTRLRQDELVRMVLESLDESNVRPNEVTISTTLKFYTLSNDREGFRRYVMRLRERTGGLVHTRPGIRVAAAAKGSFISGKEQFIEGPPMNLYVFGALINGTLKFRGVKEGMKVYYEMLREGWEPNIPILTAILRRCNLNRDWVGGFAVWQHIRESSEYISDRMYLWMLQLCRACNRQEIYDEIMRELNSQGLSMEFFPSFFTGKSSRLRIDIRDLRKMMKKQRREAAKAAKCIEEAPVIGLVQDTYDDDAEEALTMAVGHM